MLAGGFLVLQAVLLLECMYATSEWLTDPKTNTNRHQNLGIVCAQLARVLAGGFLVLQAVLLLECIYATSEWLTDRPSPFRTAVLSAARPVQGFK